MQLFDQSQPLNLEMKTGSTALSQNCVLPIVAALFLNNLVKLVDFRYQVHFLHCHASFRIQIGLHLIARSFEETVLTTQHYLVSH